MNIVQIVSEHVSEPVKHGADVVAVATPVAIFFNILPSVAALLSVCWIMLRIAIALQEYRINRRKETVQRDAVRTYRQHLDETLNEGIPPAFQRLLDSLK